MNKYLKSKKLLRIFGIVFIGVFLPTIIGDINNKLIIIPVFIGVTLLMLSTNSVND
jgi:hypothetical protein